MNMISLGETQAQHLGVDAEKLKTRMLICVSMVTAAAVSISGIIGFIGLIIHYSNNNGDHSHHKKRRR